MQETTPNKPLKVLEVAASGRNEGSVSRMLSADLVGALEERHGNIELTRRDLNKTLPFVSEAWINANFTAPEDRSAEQRAVLAESDALVAELKAADVLVIGAPIYNFGVPAALKPFGSLEVRQYVVKRPATIAKLRPGVVIERLTAYIQHAVDGTRTAESFAAGNGD